MQVTVLSDTTHLLRIAQPRLGPPGKRQVVCSIQTGGTSSHSLPNTQVTPPTP